MSLPCGQAVCRLPTVLLAAAIHSGRKPSGEARSEIPYSRLSQPYSFTPPADVPAACARCAAAEARR